MLGLAKETDPVVSPAPIVIVSPLDKVRTRSVSGAFVTLANTGGEPLEVVVLGGEPIREPVAQYGPFVMNSKAELVQAVEDYQRGRFGVVPPGALQPYRG